MQSHHKIMSEGHKIVHRSAVCLSTASASWRADLIVPFTVIRRVLHSCKQRLTVRNAFSASTRWQNYTTMVESPANPPFMKGSRLHSETYVSHIIASCTCTCSHNLTFTCTLPPCSLLTESFVSSSSLTRRGPPASSHSLSSSASASASLRAFTSAVSSAA